MTGKEISLGVAIEVYDERKSKECDFWLISVYILQQSKIVLNEGRACIFYSSLSLCTVEHHGGKDLGVT